MERRCVYITCGIIIRFCEGKYVPETAFIAFFVAFAVVTTACLALLHEPVKVYK